MLLTELKRKSLFGEITTQFHQMEGGHIQVKRRHSFGDGPYKGKELYKEIFLTPEEFQTLVNLDINNS